MKIAVTGHRPDKLGGYNATDNFNFLRSHMMAVMSGILDRGEKELIVISGGAIGIDQLWMEAAINLKLPVIAALPFKDYDCKWPWHARKIYKELLAQCSEVKYISEPGYEPSKMQTRNKWMVDNSDQLYGYWNGTAGGTKNCIDYAYNNGVSNKPIVFDIKKWLRTA